MASSSSAVADKSDDSDSDTLVDEDEEEGTISSLDDGTDRCPICLCRFVDQDIGTPESCDHIFCLECILEWSKKVTTCPVDRQKFHIILVKSASGKGVTRQIVTEEKKLDLEEEESPTYCETCGRCDREDALLLCDGCDVGYHLDCLDPPLTGVPLGDWYCPDCAAENDNEERIADEVAIGIDEVADLIAEGGADLDLPRLRHRQATLTRVARTRFSERVRALVSRNRIQRGEVQLPRVARRPSGTPTKKRKRTTRRRRGTKRGRKRRRRSTKTPKKRIANAIFANTSGDDIHQQRYNAGIRPLNIYGSDLEPSGIDESDIPSTSSGQVKSDQSQQPSFDIIGSILTEQEKLFTSSAKIRINRDGTLELRKEQAAAMEEQLRLRNLNYTPASSTRSCRSSWDKSSSSNSAMQGSTPSVRPIHDVEDPLPPRASSHCMDLNDIMNGDSNQYSPADDPPCSGDSAPSVSSESSSGTPPKQNGFATVAVPSELASDSHTTTSRPSNGDKKNHMDTIVTHLKNALKPFYCNKQVTKEEYKYIMKQGVKKIYARRSTEIRFEKVKKLVEEYVKKLTAEKQRKKC